MELAEIEHRRWYFLERFRSALRHVDGFHRSTAGDPASTMSTSLNDRGVRSGTLMAHWTDLLADRPMQRPADGTNAILITRQPTGKAGTGIAEAESPGGAN